MRDYAEEILKRTDFIRKQLENAGAGGIVFGNSGGKDSALTGILCKKACDNTIALIMPCLSAQNYESDMTDAFMLSGQFKIETRKVDLTDTAQTMMSALKANNALTKSAESNIAPRLRMAALYAVAASENRLVAGTGNRSEKHMGYFTKWGDGAFDFNPIADLTVTEIYEFLAYLKAPGQIIAKAPSAGLYDGQTDESEMGLTYKSLDEYLLKGTVSPEIKDIITRQHEATQHKRVPPAVYGE